MPWRVLIVEDSATARQALVAAFNSRAEFRVVAAVESGEMALRLARRMRPDLMSVDVVLPDTDGITVTRQVLKDIRTRILIVSTRTPSRDSPVALDALSAGAMEIVPKPNITDRAALNQLLNIAARLCEHPAPGASNVTSAADPPPPQRVPMLAHEISGVHDVRTLLRNLPPTRKLRPLKPRVVAIGASTGGPAALELMLRRLPREFRLPIIVAQHMTAGYSEGLAGWLGTAAKLPVKTATQGEALHAGHVYLAPDGSHITVNGTGHIVLTRANDSTISHVPSVDRLFDSINEAFGSAAIAVLLTGMGDDGARALKRMRASGAITIAQDQASSFVFGMPQAAVQLDPGHLVLSLEHIAHYLAGQAEKV